jgi:glycosyltransferase involved in cell wall biosynthesis
LANPRLLYLLNSFDPGGAEDAPARLLRGGAFTDFAVDVLALVRGKGLQIPDIEHAGATARALSGARRMHVGHLAQAALTLPFRVSKYDAVLLSLPQANILGRLAASIQPARRSPLILSFEHNSHLARPAYEAGFRRTSKAVDWLLADCPETARQARARLYVHAPAREIILPLVEFNDTPGFEPAPRGGAGLNLVSAGRLTPAKNHRVLIEAVHRLRSRGHPVRLTVYGEGPCRAELEAQVAGLNLRGAVELPGYVSKWWERPGDIFLLPSHHEGLCIAALEAMAAGIPVIASAVGGLLDYGHDAAVLVTDPSSGRFVEEIATLIASREIRARLAEAGIKVARRTYGRTTVRRAYSQFNRELLEVVRLRSQLN